MKQKLLTLATLLVVMLQGLGLSAQDLMIAGMMDGPLSGGTPKVLELYAINDIADLSVYTLKKQANANTTYSGDFALSGSASAGDFIYVVAGDNTENFNLFLVNSITPLESDVVNLNGDDRIAIFNSSDVLVDVLGEDGTDGTGTAWEYLNGWAYRVNGSTPNTTFAVAEWTFSGVNQLEGADVNSGCTAPFPIGTFSASGAPTVSLAITAPANNSTVTSADVNIEFTANNFTIPTDGYIKYTLDAGTAVDHQTTDAIALTALADGDHTVALELVDAAGDALATPVNASVTFTVNTAPITFTSIYDIQYTTETPANSPLLDQPVAVTGTVTAVLGGTNKGFWVQDANEAWGGIFVYNPDVAISNPALGDIVEVSGTVKEYYESTQIGDVTILTVVSSGNTVPTPLEISNADAGLEKYESVFVKVGGTIIEDPSNEGDFTCVDNTGSILIGDNIWPDLVMTIGNAYNVTGVGGYNDNSRKVYPRDVNDLEDLGAATTPLLTISSPTANQVIYVNAVDVTFEVSNFVLGTDGKVAYSVDGGTVAYESTVAPISFTGLTEGSHTINLELVDMSDASLSPEVTAAVTISVNLNPTITSVYDIQYTTAANGESTLKDQEVTIEAVVVANFNGTAHGKGYYVADAAGAWNGVYIFDTDNTPTVGDEVRITGNVVEFLGSGAASTSTQIASVSSYEVINVSQTVYAATVVTTADAGTEQYESCLVQVKDAECTETNLSYGQWKVNDGSGEIYMNDNGFTFQEVVGTFYDITGVSAYHFGKWVIHYRNNNDISEAAAIADNFASDVAIYPNPANENITLTNLVDVESIEVINLVGQTMMKKAVDAEVMSINLNDLSNGVYLVKLVANTNVRVVKIEKY